jgi:hypothetical protein
LDSRAIAKQQHLFSESTSSAQRLTLHRAPAESAAAHATAPPPPGGAMAAAAASVAIEIRRGGSGWAAAGILRPELAPLLRAIQLQRVFDDSKTAV